MHIRMTLRRSVIIFPDAPLSGVRAAINLGCSLLRTLDHSNGLTRYPIWNSLSVGLLFRIQVLQREGELPLGVLLVRAGVSTGIDLLNFAHRQLLDLDFDDGSLLGVFVRLRDRLYLGQVPRGSQLYTVEIGLLFTLFDCVLFVVQGAQNDVGPLLLNEFLLTGIEVYLETHLRYAFLILSECLLVFFHDNAHT